MDNMSLAEIRQNIHFFTWNLLMQNGKDIWNLPKFDATINKSKTTSI